MSDFDKNQIKESLTQQLIAKGANVPHFVGLVDDYVEYYALAKLMEEDIKERGLSYTAISAAGKIYEKENPCVKMLPQYTRSMLAILKELGLTTDKGEAVDEEL